MTLLVVVNMDSPQTTFPSSVYTDHNTQLAHNMGSFEINTLIERFRNSRIVTHKE